MTYGGFCRIRAAAASHQVPGRIEPCRDRDVAQPRRLPGAGDQLGFPQHWAELHATGQAPPWMLGKAALQRSIPPRHAPSKIPDKLRLMSFPLS